MLHVPLHALSLDPCTTEVARVVSDPASFMLVGDPKGFSAQCVWMEVDLDLDPKWKPMVIFFALGKKRTNIDMLFSYAIYITVYEAKSGQNNDLEYQKTDTDLGFINIFIIQTK